MPVWSLLAAEHRDRVRLYASGGSSVFSPAEVGADARLAREQGYAAFKMRVGYQERGEDLRRVAAAREQLTGADLMLDAIMGSLDPPWQAATAIERSREFAQFSPAWLEEPVHPLDFAGLAEVHAASPVPIAAGEALCGEFEFDRYFETPPVDYLQPDATHSGGMSATLDIVSRAKQRDMKVALHVWGGGIAVAANAHLAIASAAVEILEMPMMHLEVTPDMLRVPLDIRDGHLYAPQEPGLGVVLTEDTKRRYQHVPGSGYRI